MISENVCVNVATSTCCRYFCHDIYNDILKCERETNNSQREIYKLLVSHFGRTISFSKTSFIGELNQNLNYTLLNGINKDLFLQVKNRKKYGNSHDIYVTFFAM